MGSTVSKPTVAIEIVDSETHEVVKRISVAGKNPVQIEKIHEGVMHNLNHVRYWVREVTV